MTVGAWILFVIIALFIIGVGFAFGFVASGDRNMGAALGGVIGLVISLVILMGMFWYYNNTAEGARALKSQESNFNMGIKRKVTVYDMEGDVIQEYEGKFDVEYDNDRILFDDDKGLRHIIYYPTGTVIIDEVE